jgi:hypothetical protein
LLKESLHQEQNPDDQLPGLSMFLLILVHPASLKSRSRHCLNGVCTKWQNKPIFLHYQNFAESKNWMTTPSNV